MIVSFYSQLILYTLMLKLKNKKLVSKNDKIDSNFLAVV